MPATKLSTRRAHASPHGAAPSNDHVRIRRSEVEAEEQTPSRSRATAAGMRRASTRRSTRPAVRAASHRRRRAHKRTIFRCSTGSLGRAAAARAHDSMVRRNDRHPDPASPPHARRRASWPGSALRPPRCSPRPAPTQARTPSRARDAAASCDGESTRSWRKGASQMTMVRAARQARKARRLAVRHTQVEIPLFTSALATR